MMAQCLVSSCMVRVCSRALCAWACACVRGVQAVWLEGIVGGWILSFALVLRTIATSHATLFPALTTLALSMFLSRHVPLLQARLPKPPAPKAVKPDCSGASQRGGTGEARWRGRGTERALTARREGLGGREHILGEAGAKSPTPHMPSALPLCQVLLAVFVMCPTNTHARTKHTHTHTHTRAHTHTLYLYHAPLCHCMAARVQGCACSRM